MSYYLMLNSWLGEDQDFATEKMAKVFRMTVDEAREIVENLAGGNPWQFEHQVSNQQSEVAETYLRGLGFDVERIPLIGDAEDFEFAGADTTSEPEEKPGMWSRIKAVLTKKR